MAAPLTYKQTQALVQQILGLKRGSNKRKQILKTLADACDPTHWWDHSDEPDDEIQDILNSAIARSMELALLPLSREPDLPSQVASMMQPTQLHHKAMKSVDSIIEVIQQDYAEGQDT